MPTPDKAYTPATKPEEPESYHADIAGQEPPHTATNPCLKKLLDQQCDAAAAEPSQPNTRQAQIESREPAPADMHPGRPQSVDQQPGEPPDAWARLAHWGLA